MKRNGGIHLNNDQLFLILEQILAYIEEVRDIEKTVAYIKRIQKGLKRQPTKETASDHAAK